MKLFAYTALIATASAAACGPTPDCNLGDSLAATTIICGELKPTLAAE